MLVLSIIDEQNRRMINPDIKDLAARSGLFEVHIDSVLNDLLGQGYIGKEPNSQYYETYDYFVTETGKHAIERYRAAVKDFVSALMQCYHDNKKDELYARLKERRDWLWFAHHERCITRQQLQDMAALLGTSLKDIWWDESLQKWMDTALPP